MKKFFIACMFACCTLTTGAFATTISNLPAVSAAASDADVDKMLKSYDEYVTKYIAVMKKMNAGDMSVMTEYAKMMQKYQEVMKQLENCKDDMTPAQLAKFNKITARILEATK